MRDRKTAVDPLVRGLAFAAVLAVGLLLATIPAAAAGTGGISGRVTGPAGEPLEGVEVRASVLALEAWPRTIQLEFPRKNGFWAWTTTAADGSYEFSGLPATPSFCGYGGFYSLQFAPPRESGFHPAWMRGGDPDPILGKLAVEAGKTRAGVDIRLGPPASVSGTLRTQDGSAVGGAVVRAILLAPHQPTYPAWSTTADGLGRYVITGLQDAEYYLEVVAPAHGPSPTYYPGDSDPVRVRPVPGHRMEGADITLLPTGSISGTLVSGGWVEIFGASDESYWQYGTFGAGEYRFDGLQPGSYKIAFSSPLTHSRTFYPGVSSYEEALPVTVVAGEDTAGLDLAIAQPGAATGRVVDETGSPVEGVEVSVFPAGRLNLCQDPHVTYSGADGTFSVQARGDWTLHLRHEAYFPLWYPAAEDENSAVVLRFRSAETLSLPDTVLRSRGLPGGIVGRVTAGGAPLEGASVEVWANPTDSSPLGSAATDASGGYEIAGLSPRQYLVRFADETPGSTLGVKWYPEALSAATADGVVVEAGLVTAGVDGDLGTFGALEGQVSLGGSPFFPWGGPAMLLCDLAGNAVQQTRGAADGSFRFDALAPGQYLVAFDARLDYSGGEWYQDKRTSTEADAVTVPPGTAASGIDEDLAPFGFISGSVTDLTGPSGSNRIYAVDADSGGVVAYATPSPGGDPVGDYRLWLAPGSYRIYAWNITSRTVPSQWYPGSWLAAESVVVDVLSGQEVTGIDFAVEDLGVNQAPALVDPGAVVAAEGEAFTLTLSATDANGDLLTFAAEGLPAGASFDPYEGTFAWTPSCTGAGSYADVRFTVTDHGEPPLSDEVTVPVSVEARNCAPVLADPGVIVAAEGQAYELTLSATDGDGDPLTFAAEGLPAGASFDPDGGTLSWTPSCTGAGAYADVRFTVTDGGEPPLSDEVTVPVSVTARSCAPVLDPVGAHETIVGEPLVFQLSATDPDGGPVSFEATGLPEGAVLSPGDGTFSWTPAGNQSGVFQVTFAAVDIEDPLLRDEETVAITVLGPLLFRDDFSHADQAGDPDWEAGSGQWSVRGGVLVSRRTGTAIALAGPGSLAGDAFAAGRIEARARIARRGRKAPNVGFVFGYQDAGHYRYVRFLASRTEIGQVGEIDGRAPMRVRSRRGIAAGRWQRVRVDLGADGTVRAYAGSRRMATARFGAAAAGDAGVLARQAASAVDDVALWARTVLE